MPEVKPKIDPNLEEIARLQEENALLRHDIQTLRDDLVDVQRKFQEAEREVLAIRANLETVELPRDVSSEAIAILDLIRNAGDLRLDSRQVGDLEDRLYRLLKG